MSKQRILFVTSNYPRWEGDSTTPFVLNLAKDLQSAGWHIDVLAPHAPDAARKEVIQSVPVERFRYLWPERYQTVCYGGGALINLRKRPAEALKLPALVIAEWWSVVRRLMTGNYDLLHSHWILPQGFTGVLASTLLGVPHVITVHGGDVFSLRGAVPEKFKRFTLRRAGIITVNSSATRRAVMELDPGDTPVVNIPMGVNRAAPSKEDPDVVAIRKRYSSGNGPLLVFVGRVVEEKGVDDLLHAVNTLKETMPGIRALIVGEGQDRESLQELSGNLGLADHVIFTGWVDPGAIPAYMAAGDIFVGPSKTAKNGWIEAQGLTFLEAMVAGTPVIATRHGGITDSVIHEKTGLLVDENSPDQIARAIEKLVTNPGLVTDICREASMQIESRFSRQASADMFSNVYAELLAS